MATLTVRVLGPLLCLLAAAHAYLPGVAPKAYDVGQKVLALAH